MCPLHVGIVVDVNQASYVPAAVNEKTFPRGNEFGSVPGTQTTVGSNVYMP